MVARIIVGTSKIITRCRLGGGGQISEQQMSVAGDDHRSAHEVRNVASEGQEDGPSPGKGVETPAAFAGECEGKAEGMRKNCLPEGGYSLLNAMFWCA